MRPKYLAIVLLAMAAAACKSNNGANNTMNVEENLGTEMNAPEMNAPEMNAPGMNASGSDTDEPAPSGKKHHG